MTLKAAIRGFVLRRIQKVVSSLAAYATLKFNKRLPTAIPERAGRDALFDARVWNVPSEEEAANVFLWRELDASKNSISMLGQAHFSHKALHGKHGGEVRDMLHAIGVNWNDCATWQKRGTWVRRTKVATPFEPEEIEALPPKHAARTNPNLIVERSRILRLEMAPFGQVKNRTDVLFRGADPEGGC